MIIMPESRGPLEDMRWIPWRNDSSETCPAGGLVRVTGSVVKGRELVRTGNKPNADSQAGLYVNSATQVRAGKYGRITRESPCIAAYASGTPANAEVWGATSASWYLTSGKRGWLIDGAADTTRLSVPVQRVPSEVESGTSTPGLPCYAVRNNADQSISATTTTTVTLDTQIHRYPNDTTVYTLASSEVTIVQAGVYHFAWLAPAKISTADYYGAMWLEVGGVEIPGSRSQFTNGPTDSFVTFSGSLDHVATASSVYRLRVWIASAGSLFGNSLDPGNARMNIHKIREA